MRHVVPAPKFPTILPDGQGVSVSPIPAPSIDPIFDAAIHLQIEPPTGVVSSDFDEFPFPLPRHLLERGDFSLGYSEPFRVLSDEGVRALSAVVYANECFAKGNERIPKCLRGLGYRSQFVRDLNNAPGLVDLFSALAGKPLAPHSMAMNMSHVNFGKHVVKGAPPVIVDQWHVDSVDYVLVLIMSDLSESVGGDLQVLQKKGVRDNADFMAEGVDASSEHLIRTVKCPGKGYAIFMQGSQILHRVTPVLEALEPRISVVNSYMSRNVFDVDNTRFHTFNHQDPQHITKVEYCRHQAWRVSGMMNYIMEEVKWGTPKEDLAHLISSAAQLLEKTSRLVSEEDNDRIAFITEKGAQEQLGKQARGLTFVGEEAAHEELGRQAHGPIGHISASMTSSSDASQMHTSKL